MEKGVVEVLPGKEEQRRVKEGKTGRIELTSKEKENRTHPFHAKLDEIPAG